MKAIPNRVVHGNNTAKVLAATAEQPAVTLRQIRQLVDFLGEQETDIDQVRLNGRPLSPMQKDCYEHLLRYVANSLASQDGLARELLYVETPEHLQNFIHQRIEQLITAFQTSAPTHLGGPKSALTEALDSVSDAKFQQFGSEAIKNLRLVGAAIEQTISEQLQGTSRGAERS